jgi:hypothetical protein
LSSLTCFWVGLSHLSNFCSKPFSPIHFTVKYSLLSYAPAKKPPFSHSPLFTQNIKHFQKGCHGILGSGSPKLECWQKQFPLLFLDLSSCYYNLSCALSPWACRWVSPSLRRGSFSGPQRIKHCFHVCLYLKFVNARCLEHSHLFELIKMSWWYPFPSLCQSYKGQHKSRNKPKPPERFISSFLKAGPVRDWLSSVQTL